MFINFLYSYWTRSMFLNGSFFIIHRIMKIYFIVLLSITLAALAGCNGMNEKKNESGYIQEASAAVAGFDFSQTDSMEVYYFPDEKNQKVFIRHLVSDTLALNSFISFLENPETDTKSCDNDYKMFLYRNGAVYKTVYAATSDSCNYLAYVVNGVSYFMPLTDSANTFLATYR